MKTQQIKFHIVCDAGPLSNSLGGILIDGRWIICGCCGDVFDARNTDEVIIDKIYSFWVPLSEYILD